MGAAIGGALVAGGREVRWASAGRSPRTAGRATAAGLIASAGLRELLDGVAVTLAICPPAAALEVAAAVAEAGFEGVYVDANAIAPRTAATAAGIVAGAGATYVDGSIIGAPNSPGGPRLYLSGDGAGEVAALFADAAVQQRILAGPPFAASALKMAYAAWTKGSAALLLTAEQAAGRAGVGDALAQEWAGVEELGPRLAQAHEDAREKGRRWVGEMREIAVAFEELGLPSGFGAAAAETFADFDRVGTGPTNAR
jgi:3-hydroxyisobutyrate dehydrogenase-like beta-hydroxyacid dehydrogenase